MLRFTLMQRSSCSLYIVGTPIGNLGDISKRAIEVLTDVDFVLCEDTRVSAKLLNSVGVHPKLLIYNDHNAQKVIPNIVENIKNRGTTYALISDAGMPLVSDPGYKLVNACLQNNIRFTTIPGACSVISSLILSGMPGDRFMFCGFANEKDFNELSEINSTIVMFESPRRVVKTVQKIGEVFGNRKIAIVREITKIFEECIRGEPSEILKHFNTNSPKGEMVIVIGPPTADKHNHDLEQYSELIRDLKDKISATELSSILSKHIRSSKNNIYNFIKTL